MFSRIFTTSLWEYGHIPSLIMKLSVNIRCQISQTYFVTVEIHDCVIITIPFVIQSVWLVVRFDLMILCLEIFTSLFFSENGLNVFFKGWRGGSVSERLAWDIPLFPMYISHLTKGGFPLAHSSKSATVHHGRKKHVGRRGRVARHVSYTVRKQAVKGKWNQTLKPQGSSPVIYFP